MEKNDNITRRQQMALSFVALLSPVIRLLPARVVQFAGRGAWLSPLLSVPVLLLLTLMLSSLLKRRRPGEGLGEVLLDTLGPVFGRAALALMTLWLTGYAGFILRSGAERFVATIYPKAGPGFFVIALLAVSLVAALGRVSPLARLSEIFRVLLLIVLAVVLIAALPNADFVDLLPVTEYDLPGLLAGVVPVANILGVSAYFAFLEGHVEPGSGRTRAVSLNLALLLLLITAIVAEMVASFGPVLAHHLELPFFVLVRDIKILDAFERVEAVVIALWMISDFVLASVLLLMAGKLARLTLNLKKRRPAILILALLAGVGALLMAPSAIEFARVSELIIPLINLVIVFGLLPIIYIVWLIKNKNKKSKKA